jgi:hypothetical protein
VYPGDVNYLAPSGDWKDLKLTTSDDGSTWLGAMGETSVEFPTLLGPEPYPGC